MPRLPARRVIVARALPDRRLALRNGRLSVHHRGGATEQRRLSSPGELADALKSLFGITFEDRSGLESAVLAGGILQSPV